jgi:hypothetical protein
MSVDTNRITILNQIYNQYLNRDIDVIGIHAYYALTEKSQDICKIIESIKQSNEYINKKFEQKIFYNCIIPLNVYLTWHTKKLPPKMQENFDNLKQTNPEFTFNLFDDEDCENFIFEHFDIDVLNAFKKLIPGAYKADLWRYCVLYINGGIYLDIKYNCTNGFKLIELTESEHYVRDRPAQCVYNGLMCLCANNPIMLKCIRQIVQNVSNNYYGPSIIHPTGPGLLGNFFPQDEIAKFDLNFNLNFDDLIFFNNKIALKTYEMYRLEQKQYQITDHYSKLWLEKKIYYIK